MNRRPPRFTRPDPPFPHPTLCRSSPAYDKLSAFLCKLLPDRWVFGFARRRNIFLQRALYKAAKRWPQQVRAFLLNAVKRRLPAGYDMSHFTPRYMPWDERLCAVPDADLFKAISDGKASVEIGRASCRARVCQYV